MSVARHICSPCSSITPMGRSTMAFLSANCFISFHFMSAIVSANMFIMDIPSTEKYMLGIFKFLQADMNYYSADIISQILNVSINGWQMEIVTKTVPIRNGKNKAQTDFGIFCPEAPRILGNNHR